MWPDREVWCFYGILAGCWYGVHAGACGKMHTFRYPDEIGSS